MKRFWILLSSVVPMILLVWLLSFDRADPARDLIDSVTATQAIARPTDFWTIPTRNPNATVRQDWPGQENAQIDSGTAETEAARFARFSQSLSHTIDLALTSENEALDLFKILEDCSRDTKKERPSPVRALCLRNAGRLAERYPVPLRRKFEGLWDEVPKQISDAARLHAAQ